MAITYHGSASIPTDGASAANAGPGPAAITPPGSMLEGDLVILIAQYRGAVTLTISATGGQTWNSLGEYNGGTTRTDNHIWWCRFNGTWTTNPSVTNTTGTLALSGIMHVFRPTTGTNSWGVDHNIDYDEWDAADGATDVSQQLYTWQTVAASTVSFCAWFTADDNTWSNLGGTGWVLTGSAQYRNTTGQDQSSAYAHNIQTSSSVTTIDVGIPDMDQATNGADATVIRFLIFYEYAGTAQPPRSMHQFRMRG